MSWFEETGGDCFLHWIGPPPIGKIVFEKKKGGNVSMSQKGLNGKFVLWGMVLCSLVILWCGSHAAAAEKGSALTRIQRTKIIKVGWATWYPWSYIDPKSGKLSGIGPEVIQRMAQDLGDAKVEWIADNWGTLVAGLQADKFDVTYPLGVTLPRALACDFSEDTMREGMTILIRKADAQRLKTYDDVDKAEIKLATCVGTNSDLYATRRFPKAQLIRLKSSPEAVMALVLGKADASANPDAQIRAAMKEHPNLTYIKGSFALGKNSMAIKQGDQTFLNWINLFIAEMKETGELDRIFEKYGTKREEFLE